MNVVGIVTEHNPFHNGHLYHVEKARELCDAEFVISVMSGHFLQRGEPALFNKWARAKMAALGGVDLVVELPTAFAVRSASVFSHGAVSLLNAMGVVTHICFGSEAGNTADLWPAARLLCQEPQDFRTILSQYLDKGLSYPAARSKAMEAYFTINGSNNIPASLLSSPNNILGIEYMRSLLTLGSSIEPVTIKRFAAGYHDTEIGPSRSIASATSVREELKSAGGCMTEKVDSVVPSSTSEVMNNEIFNGRGPVFIESYTKLIYYLLRTTTTEQIASLCDVSEGLENRILESAKSAGSVKELIDKIKSKRYTWTRIQRIITYIMLGFTSSMARSFEETGPRYIRILGMSDKGRELLRVVKKKADLPVVIRTSPFLFKRDEISEMLEFDVKATDIYTLLYPSSKLTHPGLDYRIMPFLEQKDC